MAKLFQHISKTGKTVALILSIIGGLVTVYSLYHSYSRQVIKGSWKITCHIYSSTYKPYIGKSSGFKVFFNQDGDKIKGEGEMFWIDDIEIPYEQHVRITMEGILDGDKLHVTYTQYGAKRTTSGEMDLTIVSEAEMAGKFAGTAADAKGVVNAQILN